MPRRAKVICYQLLIRPIITYAAPIWFNSSASLIERIRIFERKCLRTCLGLHRSAVTEFQTMICNKKIYNEAKVPRIDNFCIKLTRRFYVKNKKIENKHVQHCLQVKNNEILRKRMVNGYLPPESFTNLDALGLIQDTNNIPISYHWPRNQKNKSITYDAPFQANEYPHLLKYSRAIPNIDAQDFHRLSIKKYWWLNEDSRYLMK